MHFFLNFYEVNHLELGGNEAERNKQYNELNKQPKRHLELSCLKNRNGKTGFVIDHTYFSAAETFVENGLSLPRVQEPPSNLAGDGRKTIDAKSFKPQPRKRRSKKDDIPFLESELFTQQQESCPSGQ